MKADPLLLAAALLAGCSTTLVRETPVPVRAADGVLLETTPLVEALLGLKGTRVQAANGSWKDKVFSAAQGLGAKSWHMKRQRLSHRPTTRWNELLKVR